MDTLNLSRRPPAFWLALALIVALLLGGCLWLFWPQKAVLFSGLSSEDAAQISAQLDKEKIPYSLNEAGDTIFMAPDLIPKARLQVFSDNLVLKSGVGLELFSGNDLGMTEFSQHVNYVRALQGEMTRTLLGIEGVDAARVHIAMPEGSSRRSQATPIKVAITLNSKDAIAIETVKGVQRFVTAAVPGVRPGDVVILDGKGNLLTSTQASPQADGSPVLGSQLEQKAAIEAYLEKKAAKLLHNIALPPARAEVIVDVTLSESQRNITREELIPSGQLRGLPVGLLQQGHFNRHPPSAPAPVRTDEGTETVAASEPKIEDRYEFANGKQIEQISNPIGSIVRVSVSVVVVGTLPLNAEQALQRALSHGLGLNTKRGDDISVLIMPAGSTSSVSVPAQLDEIPVRPAQSAGSQTLPSSKEGVTQRILIAGGVGLILLGLLLFVIMTRKPRQTPEALADELRGLLGAAASKTG